MALNARAVVKTVPVAADFSDAAATAGAAALVRAAVIQEGQAAAGAQDAAGKASASSPSGRKEAEKEADQGAGIESVISQTVGATISHACHYGEVIPCSFVGVSRKRGRGSNGQEKHYKRPRGRTPFHAGKPCEWVPSLGRWLQTDGNTFSPVPLLNNLSLVLSRPFLSVPVKNLSLFVCRACPFCAD